MAFKQWHGAAAFFVLLMSLSTAVLAAEPAPVIQAAPPQPSPSTSVTTQKDFAKGHSKTPVTANSRCGEVGAMQYMLMSERKLAYLATAIDSAQIVHIYMRNPKTESWAELEMGSDLIACIVREGTDFHFLFKQ
ncbi:MAG: hypothetical protein PW788_01265 [Micavibrio sp.]|nr:hypothetical protein [Micavibrio sp.]